MSDTASKMPAKFRITWRDGAYFVSIPNYDGGEVVPVDIVERMAEALKECQSALATLTTPEAIKATNVASAWVSCVAAESKARTALNSYREASNDQP